MSQLLTSEGAVNSRGPQMDVTPFVAHASPLGTSGRLRIGVRSKSSGELRYFDEWRHGHGIVDVVMRGVDMAYGMSILREGKSAKKCG